MKEHELYEKYKKLLFSLAYQMTGSAADAEDAVQDVFVKFYLSDHRELEEPKAYLCKMVTNHCIDFLRSARKRREQYFGPWLPEPIPTPEDDLVDTVVRTEMLSYALLVLLERLSPAERAVFVLREALRFEYTDIAEWVGKSEVYCRKLMSRARLKMGISEEELDRFAPAKEDYVRKFVSALEQGKVETVLSLLDEDVVLLSDGGGKAVAAAYPIRSSEHVLRFLLGLVQQAPQYENGIQIELAPLNSQTGIIVRSGEDIVTVILFHAEEGVIRNLYFIRNPDKLVSL